MSKESRLKGLNDIPLSAALRQMTDSYWTSQCLYVAAKLGIADQLKNGPQRCDELAKSTGTHARSLYRLMRALASIGVFVEHENGCFGLTPVGKFLQSEIPGSMRARTILHGEELYRAWGDLIYSVMTGHAAFKKVFGMSHFEYLSQNIEAAKIFNEAMAGRCEMINKAVTAAYDFSSIEKIVDVGGGYGSLIASILKIYPKMKGILFESPHVIEAARGFMDREGLSERCKLVGGDFFESVPGGGDTYILLNVIHDWSDDATIEILKNCRRVMQNDAKLLLVERIIPPGNEPFMGKFMDLHMLVTEGGCERTKDEYQKLFTSAGFELTNIVPTQSPLLVSVIEGMPA